MKMLLIAALTSAVLVVAAQANPVIDALFAEGIFDAAPEGQTIAYAHSRQGAAAADFTPVTDARIVVVTGRAADGEPSLSLTMESGDRKREVDDFPGSGGNPVLMVFLESAVRSMAAMSGGSPFYIRNRIKDSLRQSGDLTETSWNVDGREIVAQEVLLHPFKGDPNRDRMGAFAGLRLRFVVSDAVPGRLLLLSADTPADTPADASLYRETITLTGAEEGQ